MRFSDVRDVVQTALLLDKPIMLWGAPGVGKSDLVRSIPHENLIDLRAVLMEAVDLKGMPARDGDVMRWLPIGELPQDPDSKGILFLDELNAAEDDVMKACFGLVLDRKLGEYHLPKGWRIIAAGNRTEDRASAKRMPSALANRFSHVTLDANLDDWTKWGLGKGNMPHELISFLNFKQDLLHDFDPDQHCNPTPRSWATVGDAINHSDITGASERNFIAATIGEGPAADFVSYLTIARSLPDIDKILEDPNSQPTPTEVATIFATVGALAGRVERSNVANFMTYVQGLSAEYTALAVKLATTRNEDLMETSAICHWFLNNQEMLAA